MAYVAYPKIDEDEDEGGQSHTSCRFRRGTVESIEQDRRSLTYGVSFDDGQYLEGIDKSLVMPEHRYLHKNLKKVSAVIKSTYNSILFFAFIKLTL